MEAPGNGRGGGGRGRYRGRGGRYGRGGRHHDAAAPSPQGTNSNSRVNDGEVPPSSLELDVESVTIPHAFESSCAHVKRCRERGRLFHLPLPSSAVEDFAVVERTIGGIDDMIYNKHREVWERLPRGNARVYVRETTDGPYVLVGAVNGLRKFGYNDATYGYPDAVTTVVAVEKENGECGHISAFVLPLAASEMNAPARNDDGTTTTTTTSAKNRFWIVGSKNVHVVLDYYISDACLEYYHALGRRYSYAIKIARLWRAMLHRASAETTTATTNTNTSASRMLTAAQALAFHDMLHTRKWTSCFEAIFSDSQHLVDYDGANELRFYALTSNARAFGAPPAEAPQNGATDEEAAKGDSAEVPSSTQQNGPFYSREDGLCLPVNEADALYTGVGLAFSHHSSSVVYRSEDYAKLVDTIGRRRNSEGCVMYGADDAGRVVRLWKEKSYPYVMERATREAITNHKLAGKDLADAMRKKLKQQRTELRDFFNDWEATRMPWLLHFAAWLQMTRRLAPSMQREDLFRLRNQWLSLQKEFQADMDRDPELYDVCGQYQPDPVQWGSDTKDLDVIKFVGPQGCGKSTLSRALYALLGKARYNPRWVNQDEAGNRNKFLASLRQATHAEAGVTHLLIDKMNLDARMNHDYDNLPLSVTVVWYHPDGENALYDVCIERVLGRGSGHRTVRLDPSLTPPERAAAEQNIRSFVRKAVRACETPQDPSEAILELDITTPLQELVRMVWAKLQENGTNTLPAITDDDIHEALTVAHRYEALLCELPTAPIYACIGLPPQGDEAARLLAIVPPAFTDGQVVQATFHVTTRFFGGETDPVAFVALAERLGQSVTLTLDSVVGDADGVAVTVRRDDARYPCANPVPHFTISNRKGVPPKYSSQLISEQNYPGDLSQRRVVRLAEGITVTGVFEFR
ncbi:hypothetical protein ABB37_05857 [Leptomonas pyrrhocoris]|uniref:Uncharacterized protein n=1 Tax=Leptomonas pyrrhocoris TaxID=157538 RepID=A0A0M9FYS2_LEPPY|nr:hypothetical protein ABB37_05857 [Leptomonas pyrrhocoris]XP_015657173.1 hypothetical protein ABB37_05857 [Leptomonas pyrrhocoris]XP_015657174.1 hypothetical protein ABB37_05857 [Leptomonas pyrrhocoris]KPA78733.1 hypothetical protein ABB37_05857 [Leptomonas pyrrhocoris]KPA78734.1 hypothetical protein ABB37_05857 [Leptomonas pyrrhocoris]KPA78735.1 hypothetical protein ABB37_05857 [Leptomonas pyrrhocoris]|eukprot:XP_015657172.1 hypothetical protein ABB37_05857 [Leptomonas pyrrhocoris]